MKVKKFGERYQKKSPARMTTFRVREDTIEMMDQLAAELGLSGRGQAVCVAVRLALKALHNGKIST